MRSRAVHRARRGRRARVPERGIGRFIQSTWLSIFPGKVATGKGRTLLERPATPARRTLATRGATAPAKQMEDISLAFSTLVDDATSNGEGRSLTLAHSPLQSVDDPMAAVRKMGRK